MVRKVADQIATAIDRDKPPTDDNTTKEYWYRLLAALVHRIGAPIRVLGAQEAERFLRDEAALVNGLKELILQEKDTLTGRSEFVKRTAGLVRSMLQLQGGVPVAVERTEIIASLDKANVDLSGVDSWEIFDSNQRRGLKCSATYSVCWCACGIYELPSTAFF